MAAIEEGNFDAALACFEEAEAQGEEPRALYRGKGIALLGKSEYNRAVEALETALSKSGPIVDATDYDINFYLAAAYFKNGDEARALNVYNAILALQPKNRDALYLRGSVFLKQGDYESACADFEQVIDLDPADMEGLIRICELLGKAGYRQIALEYLTTAQGNAASKSMTDFDRGRICYYQEDYENAKTYLEKARDTENPDTALFLGRTYEALGDYNYAVSVYMSFLQSNTDNAELYNQLGLCRMHQGAYEEALTAFQNGLGVENGMCRQELAFNEIVAEEYLGEFKRAAVLMETYLASYPDDENAQREYIFLKTR